MMFEYDFDRLNAFLKTILKTNLPPQALSWLEGEGAAAAAGDVGRFNIAFVAMPRRTGKELVKTSDAERNDLLKLRKGMRIDGWSADRLSRMWLLLQLDARNKDQYVSSIENLFLNAEMSELVALYSSLPLLAYPEAWKKRCAEGIRSNIALVLESVICNNPYPAEQLDDAAWNQLVLKAIFTEKPLLEIIGLRDRMNADLAEALTDYAHERWAAHRPVLPLLWLCVAPYLEGKGFDDVRRLFASPDPLERQAAALACQDNGGEEARRLLEQNPEFKSSVENGKVTWTSLASEIGKR